MILSFLFFSFLAYILFKLVVNVIIPVYKTTRRVRKGFQEMKQHMQAQQGHASAGYSPNAEPAPRRKKQAPQGDYIDFEEVKD